MLDLNKASQVSVHYSPVGPLIHKKHPSWDGENFIMAFHLMENVHNENVVMKGSVLE